MSGLIEIHLDKSGKGEGKLVPAAKVSWDKQPRKSRSRTTTLCPWT
jgi:hypothetical protein